MPERLPFDDTAPFRSGQRLQCPRCGSEIEIVQPSGIQDPNQVLRCCGEDMVPVHSNPDRSARS